MTEPSAHYSDQGSGTRTLEMLEEATRYNAWVFSWIAPHLGEKNVELGAGHGTLTGLALATHAVSAIEPSAAGRQKLKERFESHPRLSGIGEDFLALPRDENTDCVYSANVLEHVADDIALLEHAAGVLKPGGRFVAVVPAGLWLYSRFDAVVGHYRRYTRADRLRLTTELTRRRVPLQFSSFVHRNPLGALGWFAKMRLLERESIDPADVQQVERWVPWLRRLDSLSPPFGQSLVMVLTRVGPMGT